MHGKPEETLAIGPKTEYACTCFWNPCRNREERVYFTITINYNDY